MANIKQYQFTNACQRWYRQIILRADIIAFGLFLEAKATHSAEVINTTKIIEGR